MGEKKQRQKPALTEAERMERLSSVSFERVFDEVFEIQRAAYEKAGEVPHTLNGLDFENGKIAAVHSVHIRRKEDVQGLLMSMLEHWPMVLHVFEAWSAPDGSAAPSEHPRRQDVVSIYLHTTDTVAAASCPADPKKFSLTRAPLVYPDRVEGNMRTFERPRMN